jgi:cyanophycinase
VTNDGATDGGGTGHELWASAALGAAGAVMVIGGAEDKVRDRTILSRFARLAGGDDAKVVVVSTASSLGEAATDTYRAVLSGLGIGDVEGLRPEEREEADDPAAVRLLAEATGVFLTGGNQSRLTQVVGGTRLGDALANAHDRGAVLAGTSAGASAMASHMVAFGQPGTTPKNRMVQLSAGLGILPGLVVDQHFEQRGRHGRLLAVVAQSPSLLGMGIDEDTCAIVHPDQTLQILGKGAVTIVDGRHVKTDAYRGKGYKPLMVSGAILHSLPSGYWFDLRSRSLLAGGGALGREREASE